MANGNPDPASVQSASGFKSRIIWKWCLTFGALHLGALYGVYLCIVYAAWKTRLFAVFLYVFCLLGITAGAHRLWSHRSYKAKLPLRILLAIMNTVAWQWSIYDWVRDHRVHHKYSETSADPHNAKRGFFFSHIAWDFMERHPDVWQKIDELDVRDLLADPVVRIQRKFYVPLAVLLCFLLPTVLPVVLWGEDITTSFFVAGVMRFVLALNATFFVNSAAHMWGNRPYDKYINPAENMWITGFILGEGFHNYHHTFPWDYATSEYGIRLNLSTVFIDLMAWLGLAYDCKTVTPEMISERKKRTGDCSCLKKKACNE